MEDIFSQFGDIFGGGGMGGFSSAGFGGGGRPRRQQRRGTDLRITIKMTLADIASGVSKTLKIPTFVKDAPCNGTGAKNGTSFNTCPTCGGSGTIIRQQQTLFPVQDMPSVGPRVCVFFACGGGGEECGGCGGGVGWLFGTEHA